MGEKLHTCNLCLEKFQESLNKMETKIDNLYFDLDAVTASRRRQENLSLISHSIKTRNINSMSSDISASELEILLLQLRESQTKTKDLTEKNAELTQSVKALEREKDEYRIKYFDTQILLEERNQQVESWSRDSQNVQDKISRGLKLAEDRFNAELDELRMLPAILQMKQTEIDDLDKKLKISGKTSSTMSADLESCIVKYEVLSKTLQEAQNEYTDVAQKLTLKTESCATLEQKCVMYEIDIRELHKIIVKIPQLEESVFVKNRDLKNLTEQIEILKSENERHVNRIKERAASQYHEKLNEILEYENDVVKLRATLNTVTKERDEMRYHLQMELSNLGRRFSDAQQKIQLLKGHVDMHHSVTSCSFEKID